MNAGVYVFVQTLLGLLNIVVLGMIARMLVGFFTMGEDTKLGRFLFVLTEPMIYPIRILCDRIGLFRGSPMDMPFFITSLLLLFVRILLENLLL